MLQEMNIALRFVLELCSFGTIGYWGFRMGKMPAIKISFAIILPLIVAIIWGLFGALGTTWRLQDTLHLVLEIMIFGLGVVALYHLKYVTLATVLAVIIIINSSLMYIWEQ
ncbi:YrdB family protein [Bacillus bingmayongensis]|uniref:YrdB family protein n=1 Tax=Bacillus bingmayongensis TaxID=1150157 RepID=UPI0002DC5954|nr:YrdB family protein [Bacillus bingmayongensis]MBY0597124.1 YrdB family protein [Bacillus bingmayongensis]